MFLIIKNIGKNYIFRCEGKELIDKGLWDKGFMWNPSNCECECDKACNVGEYLDQENCKCRKILVEKWVDEIVEEVKLAKITLAENENKYKCSSCTVYTVLFWIFLQFLLELLLFILLITIGLWLKIMFLALDLVFTKKQKFGKHINGRNKTNKY